MVASFISAPIQANDVVVFGKTNCPYTCHAVSKLTASKTKFKLVIVSDEQKEQLKAETKQRTQPFVFIKQKFIGGCDDLVAMFGSGEIVKRGVKVPQPDARSTLLFFPESCNNNVARSTGFISLVGAVATIAVPSLAPVVPVFMGTDYLLRFAAGSSASPMGIGGKVVNAGLEATLGIKPNKKSGLPMQFAALCGLIFSSSAAAFYLLDQPFAGQLALGGLAAANFLQSVCGFCLGCFMFKHILAPLTIWKLKP